MEFDEMVTGEELAANENGLGVEAELEKLPDPLEAAREAAAQLEEAASLLRGVVNTLESLEA